MNEHIKNKHSLSGQEFLCVTCSCKIICSVQMFKKHLKSKGHMGRFEENTSRKEECEFFVCQVCPKQRKHPRKMFRTHLKGKKHRTNMKIIKLLNSYFPCTSCQEMLIPGVSWVLYSRPKDKRPQASKTQGA